MPSLPCPTVDRRTLHPSRGGGFSATRVDSGYTPMIDSVLSAGTGKGTAMEWITTTDREGRRCYARADGHIILTGGYGRMRFTVIYPPNKYGESDYGMTDTLREAKAWADA